MDDSVLNIRRNKLFSSFLNTYEDTFKDILVYWDVVFPMIFSFEYQNNLYLSYVITCDDFEKELDIITTKVADYGVLKSLTDSSTSIFDIFDREFEDTCLFYSKRADKVFSKRVSLGDSCDYISTLTEFHGHDYLIEDLLPEDDFYLESNMINKSKLKYIQSLLTLVVEEKKYIETNFIEKRTEISSNKIKVVTYENKKSSKKINIPNNFYNKENVYEDLIKSEENSQARKTIPKNVFNEMNFVEKRMKL